MSADRRVVVVGAGVSGLTTAIRLAEARHPVRVVASEQPLGTTSNAAGAIWGPYLSQDERVLPWSDETRQVLLGLTDRSETTGVRDGYGLEAARVPVTPPQWAQSLPRYRPAAPHELPPGFDNGWWYAAPLVDMPVYLCYLQARLEGHGVSVTTLTIDALPEPARTDEVLINCTGANAAKLAGDDSIDPTRGQLVVVENPGITEFFCEHDESPLPIYYLPHGRHIVLGGSIEHGNPSRDPDPAMAGRIVERCASVEPRLAGLPVLEHRIGTRPNRPSVRLEHELVDGVDVVHNYGHGGAGVTVSWGCAAEVVRLVDAL